MMTTTKAPGIPNNKLKLLITIPSSFHQHHLGVFRFPLLFVLWGSNAIIKVAMQIVKLRTAFHT